MNIIKANKLHKVFEADIELFDSNTTDIDRRSYKIIN